MVTKLRTENAPNDIEIFAAEQVLKPLTPRMKYEGMDQSRQDMIAIRGINVENPALGMDAPEVRRVAQAFRLLVEPVRSGENFLYFSTRPQSAEQDGNVTLTVEADCAVKILDVLKRLNINLNGPGAER